MRRRTGLALSVALAGSALGALTAPSASLGSFPGPNGRIVVEQGLPLFAAEPVGGGGLLLTGAQYVANQPAVSADGNLVVFQRGAGGDPPGYGIWTVRSDGTDARQVTVEAQTVAGNDGDPTWSPDGSRIAFVRQGDLHVMNADGSGTTNLTPAFASPVADPDWSPDGSRIAFAASNQLYVIGAGGTPGPTQLNAPAPGNRSFPSWAPDGSRIAYTRGPPGPNGGIWAINPDGSGEGPLVPGLGEVWELAWSPDGTRIGFISDVGNTIQEELWTVGVDGSGLTQLNVDTDIGMAWGPRGSASVAPPVLGSAVNVEVVRGTVLVAVPAGSAARAGGRASQKGLVFVPLTAERQVPVGSFLDTRRGTVELVSATGSGQKTQAGRFNAGLFQVLQSRARSQRGLTELRLKGSSFSRCRARGASAGAGARAAQLSRRTIRRLRATAKGRFRTRGRHSAATVRGTVWVTADRCDGTLTQVKRGKVAVRDLRRKRTITLTAGKSYLAKAPR